MTIDDIATFEVDGETVEVWAIPYWFDKEQQAVRVLRTKELLESMFVILVSNTYIGWLESEGNIGKFKVMMGALATDMVRHDFRGPES